MIATDCSCFVSAIGAFAIRETKVLWNRLYVERDIRLKSVLRPKLVLVKRWDAETDFAHDCTSGLFVACRVRLCPRNQPKQREVRLAPSVNHSPPRSRLDRSTRFCAALWYVCRCSRRSQCRRLLWLRRLHSTEERYNNGDPLPGSRRTRTLVFAQRHEPCFTCQRAMKAGVTILRNRGERP